MEGKKNQQQQKKLKTKNIFFKKYTLENLAKALYWSG